MIDPRFVVVFAWSICLVVRGDDTTSRHDIVGESLGPWAGCVPGKNFSDCLADNYITCVERNADRVRCPTGYAFDRVSSRYPIRNETYLHSESSRRLCALDEVADVTRVCDRETLGESVPHSSRCDLYHEYRLEEFVQHRCSHGTLFDKIARRCVPIHLASCFNDREPPIESILSAYSNVLS